MAVFLFGVDWLWSHPAADHRRPEVQRRRSVRLEPAEPADRPALETPDSLGRLSAIRNVIDSRDGRPDRRPPGLFVTSIIDIADCMISRPTRLRRLASAVRRDRRRSPSARTSTSDEETPDGGRADAGPRDDGEPHGAPKRPKPSRSRPPAEPEPPPRPSRPPSSTTTTSRRPSWSGTS